MKRYHVPVIVTVEVVVDDDGQNPAPLDAYVDSAGGPWAFSADPAAYDLDTLVWHESGSWRGEEPWELAANAAYDHVDALILRAKEGAAS